MWIHCTHRGYKGMYRQILCSIWLMNTMELGLYLPNEDGVHKSDSEGSEQYLFDCKETPGLGCDSAEWLRIIREGKRPVLEASETPCPPRNRDSTNLYAFCNDGGACVHTPMRATLLPSEATEDMVVTSVRVPRLQLGLSPRAG